MSLEQIVDCIAAAKLAPVAGSPLIVATAPSPFVAPPLEASDSPAAEFLFVEASAAIGKSTLAAHVSAARRVPLLNLASVRVSTGALAGLLSTEFGNPVAAQAAFHAGELPILIDALDEGRGHSGELHVEDFLSTTLQFILSNRAVTNRPKVILLGRPEARGLAEAVYGLHGSGVTSSWIQLEYFGELEARELVDAYARLLAKPDAAYVKNPGAATEAVTAYFGAIERALGLGPGKIWKEETGTAFVGYAPVLAALGALLATETNFIELTNELRSAGHPRAWGVIERVVSGILKRECEEKFQPALARRLKRPSPPEAYDLQDQMRIIVDHVDGKRPTPSDRVTLTGADLSAYLDIVKQLLGDHPFLRQSKFANSVLASIALARAVIDDRLPAGGEAFRALERESRNPFLWRSLQPLLKNETWIDGRYLGAILCSFWNDPLTSGARKVMITGAEATVVVPTREAAPIEFHAVPPLALHSFVDDCDINVDGNVRFEGNGTTATSTFRFVGRAAKIACRELDIAAEAVALGQGEIWLDPTGVLQRSPRLEIVPQQAKFWWGPTLAKTYPWSGHAATLDPPQPTPELLADILTECAQRFPLGHSIALYKDLTPVEDDPHTTWTARYPVAFPRLIALLLDHRLATKTPFGTKGSRPKVHVSVSTNWNTLVEALRDPQAGTSDERTFLAVARQQIS